jgi:hypothetical protein
VTGSRAPLGWIALAIVAGAIAVAAVARWVWAITLDGPVLYGEGAVAHAALLARDRLEYVAGAQYGGAAPIFTAANYPPLYFRLAGLGDPFIVGRIESGVATLAVAAAIAWRGRAGGILPSAAFALAWLATLPAIVWGVAVKPDLVALALTVGAVLAVERRSFMLGGALIALGAFAKPTELLPAVALAAVIVASRDLRGLASYVIGALAAAAAGAALTVVPDPALLTHVVTWNALPFHADQAALLALVAIIAVGAPVIASVVARRSLPPAIAAYLVAGVAIVLLGGREGATINYVLDLAAGSFLALASIASLVRAQNVLAVAIALELVLVVALFDPFGIVPGRAPGTGAWADPSRIVAIRAVAGPALVEDAGLLIANGTEPLVDDLFLWSRLHDTSASFEAAGPLLDAVRSHRFAAVVSEADLEHISAAPAYERQRWADTLASAVLEGYRLDHRDGALWIYVPR